MLVHYLLEYFDNVDFVIFCKQCYIFSPQLVKWSDYCLPLAFKPGEPYILFAEASIDNFSSLGIAFMEDRLQMDNGMVPHKIMCKYYY